MSNTIASHDVELGHHEEAHHKQGFWSTYVFSTDHKTIGYQYLFTGLAFLAIGFYLIMVMRWSIAYPEKELPNWLALFVKNSWLSEGKVSGDLYNTFGAMHGTIMVFLGIVPVAFAAFGNFVTPLQIGAIDMAFPKLNMASYWVYFIGGAIMLTSFFLPSGAAEFGWTNYPPGANIAQKEYANIWQTGHTYWLLGMVFLITSSLLGSVNFITTIINLRTEGMTWMRLPFFVWAMLIVAFLLLLAFPPLEVAALMQLSDRVFGSSFFTPTGLFVGGELLDASGGGSPILYQHLFWFLAHPEVYVLILPGIAIVAEIIPANIRKPLWGYRSMVYAVFVLGFLAFIVWAHHMYLTGMGNVISTFFQTTTVLISVPSVILLTCLFISLWGGSIRFTVPMLFATAFLPMFGIGGLTGLPLAFSLIDLQLHDTYYVIAHFHYIVAPGTIFAIFAGIYHWFPKATGKMMNTFLGHLHFWPSLICMNGVFFPMFLQGMKNFHRRWSDGGKSYESVVEEPMVKEIIFPDNSLVANIFNGGHAMNGLDLNAVITLFAFGLAIAQIPFILNLILSLSKKQRDAPENPWRATTLEWAAPNRPGHGNFKVVPTVYRDAYGYSIPGHPDDFTPQWEPDPEPEAVSVDPSVDKTDH